MECQQCYDFDEDLLAYAKQELSKLGALNVELVCMYEEEAPPQYSFKTEEWMKIRPLLAIAAHKFPCSHCADARNNVLTMFSKAKLWVSGFISLF